MKFNNMKMLMAALVVLLVAAFAISQETGGPPAGGPAAWHHHHGFDGGPLGFYSKALGLTDQQKTQIKQIIANEKPTLHPLMEQQGQTHQQMMQLITSGNFDEAKAQTIAAQQAQTITQLEVEHAKIMSQAYQLLTPEQKTKFAQLEANHAQHMAEHMKQEQSEPQTPNQ